MLLPIIDILWFNNRTLFLSMNEICIKLIATYPEFLFAKELNLILRRKILRIFLSAAHDYKRLIMRLQLIPCLFHQKLFVGVIPRSKHFCARNVCDELQDLRAVMNVFPKKCTFLGTSLYSSNITRRFHNNYCSYLFDIYLDSVGQKWVT